MRVTPGTVNVLGAINAAKATNERVYGNRTDRKGGDSTVSGSPSKMELPAASASDFSIADDPAVSAQARQGFLAGITRSSGKPVADQIDQQLGAITDTFAQMIGPFGLHANDFADVMTAYTIVVWMAANRRTELHDVAQVQGVCQQVRHVIAGKLGDTHQRQLVAETMMYQTCMLVGIREQAPSKNRPDLLDTAASAIDRGSPQNGQHLRTLALTDDGLVRQ